MIINNELQKLAEKQVAHETILQMCRDDFYFFVRYAFFKRKGYKWKRNWHHETICRKLEKVYSGEITRLIINIPPRFSKTDIVVIAFIAWTLGKSPDSEYIHPSYSKTLATLNSYQIRDIVQQEWYREIFPDVVLKTDSNKKDEWRTTRGGCVYATGTEGTITGFGAGKMREGFGGFVAIDDPHKAGEAASIVKRKSVIDWYSTTLESRLNKKETPIVIIMQRLHQEDLSGFLLNGGSNEKWEHLILPVINEEGVPLWEEKLSLPEIQRLEKTNSYVFAGQYMQRPSPKGGGMFKDEWWQYYDKLPEIESSFIVADTAMKAKETSDYSVLACWGVCTKGRAYLIDLTRGKWEAPELQKAFVAFWNKNKHNSSINLRKALVEDKASGTGLIQTIKRDYTIPISGIQRKAGQDKVWRANEIVSHVESGYVYLPKNAHFISDFIAEHSVFPNGTHDDIVDTTADALNNIFNKTNEYKVRVIY